MIKMYACENVGALSRYFLKRKVVQNILHLLSVAAECLGGRSSGKCTSNILPECEANGVLDQSSRIRLSRE